MFFSDLPPAHEYLVLQDRIPVIEDAFTRIIPYGGFPEQFGQLFLPKAGDGHPVVVLVHGGCWRSEFGFEGVQALAAALRSEGVAVWSIEYRRLGSGGGWPETFLDVALAMDYLRVLAPEFSLDLTKLVTVGHSAGGQLALWLGARGSLGPESDVFVADPLLPKGVLSLAGIADLERSIEVDICDGLAERLLGGEPSVFPKRYKQGSPERLLPLKVPQVVLQGLEDRVVPFEYGEAYVYEARRLGDEVSFVVLDEAGHFDLIRSSGVAWPKVREAVFDLLAY